MMNPSFYVLLLFLVLSSTGFTQNNYFIIDGIKIDVHDNLIPTASFFDLSSNYEYKEALTLILLNELPPETFTKAIITPSFAPEGILFSYRDTINQTYKIEYRTTRENIWYSKKRDKLKVKSYSIVISQKDIELLKSLYEVFLMEMFLPKQELYGTDGITYTFSLDDSSYPLGTCWSPSENSKLGKLVEINEEIISHLQTRKKLIFDAFLNAKIENLIHEITAANKSNK